MKSFVSVLVLLLFNHTVGAETAWEIYLAYPSAGNAKPVTAVTYSNPKSNALGYVETDLVILQNQVNAGDIESLRLAFRLRSQADGGLLEDLTALIGHSIRINPVLFLNVVNEVRPHNAE